MVVLRRIGRSMILEISAAASTPQKAVEIADTLAKEYIRKNILMKAQAARQYSEWLEKFVIEQQRGLAEAANALATFKSNPRDQFKLAELQSAADARRTLYESTLTQFTEAKQRISYSVSDATIVSQATSPLSKARPRSGLIVAFATAVGTGAGLMLAMIWHAGDRRIVRAQRLAEAAGLPFVTLLARSEKTRNGHSAYFLAAEAGSGSTADLSDHPRHGGIGRNDRGTSAEAEGRHRDCRRQSGERSIDNSLRACGPIRRVGSVAHS